MNLCVFGLWHLGTVTAACLAQAGHQVIGLDYQADVIEKLRHGVPPLYEPGLEELVQATLDTGTLGFTTDPATALQHAEVVWVTFDTPVDEDDQADSAYVIQQVETLFPYLAGVRLVLISSQLPVGSTRQLEQSYRQQYPEGKTAFGYSPENLRLGKAIQVFTRPDRVVIGLSSEADRATVQAMLEPITQNIVWMSVESAEMTKHALNAFLAVSVTFINEIAAVCEQVGADAGEVEKGLKSEPRIGPGAYLRPGGAFAGGTLARDVRFLQNIGAAHALSLELLHAVTSSNHTHQEWAYRRLQDLLGNLAGSRIAILGLSYKPGTNTLRRSPAITLCRQLLSAGAIPQAHDPMVKTMPDDLAQVPLYSEIADALQGANAAVIATEWVDYRALTPDTVIQLMKNPLLLDANRFLSATLGADTRIHYITVGKPA